MFAVIEHNRMSFRFQLKVRSGNFEFRIEFEEQHSIIGHLKGQPRINVHLKCTKIIRGQFKKHLPNFRRLKFGSLEKSTNSV